MMAENQSSRVARCRASALWSLAALACLAGCSEQRMVIDRASSPTVDLVVRYPEHIARGSVDSISIDVRNPAASALEDAVLLLDSAYAPIWRGPLDVQRTPGVYAIRLASIAPEESRTISALVPRREDEGVQAGRVAVAVGRDTLSIQMHTVVGRR